LKDFSAGSGIPDAPFTGAGFQRHIKDAVPYIIQGTSKNSPFGF